MRIDQYQIEAARKRFAARAAVRERNVAKIAQGDLLGVDTPDRVERFLERRGYGTAEAKRLIADVRPAAAAVESIGSAREPHALERVLGTSDLMGVAFLERGLQVAQTVGRILIDATRGGPSGYGTGFLVSPRLLLTNHHVLGDPGVAARSAVEFEYQLGLDGQPRATSTFAIDAATLHLASEELDYALVAVQPTSGNGRRLTEFGWNRLIAEEGKAIAGQWVNIIQHPNGGLKQLALRENLLIDVFDSFLQYQTDTAPGSSGSPVLNDRWEVVGLHHSGVWAKDEQGRILSVDGQLWTEGMGEDRIKWIANEGIRVSRILASLRAQATDGRARELVEELLDGRGQLSRRDDAQRPAPIPAASRAAGTPEFTSAPDGTATWTVPLSISIRVGGAMAAAAAPAASQQPPVPVATPSRGDDDARSPDDIVAAARAELGGRTDVLGVRLGYVFRDGWITKERAVVVTVRRRRSPQELRESGVAALPERFRGLPVEVTDPVLRELVLMGSRGSPAELLIANEALGQEIVYQPPAGVPLAAVCAEMRVIAHVSPDHGWPVLSSFLAKTRKRLVVGMFDVGAPHIVDALVAAGRAASFDRLTLVLQHGSSEGEGTKQDDIPDEQVVEQLGVALGARFETAWVRLGRVRGWVASSYHIKVAVRDQKAFWLSSGNWQSSNQPQADPLAEVPPQRKWLDRYNREWHAVVEHAGLAKTFEAYLVNDFKRNLALAREAELVEAADLLLPAVVIMPPAAERAREFRYFAPFDQQRHFKVLPLLTPDNFHAEVLGLVNGAQDQLLIQNQTFNAPKDGQERLGELVRAVLAKQRAGLDVRIIFRVLRAADARANLEALQELGFDLRAVKVQTNCHTKGVIVDDARVLLGSQNWSSDGVSLNRDASLLFDDVELAGYFRGVFEHDWRNLARQDIGRESLGTELVGRSAPTPDGMIRLSWKDYAEMA